ncbi:MAG TPA: hypothetical protein DDW52_07430 [Planctomycetaceae bacterium]|nr:hypothetical protein [Planctomycetaceae bacterium]
MIQSAFDLVDALLDAGVPLVIIGGHAVNAHGFLRATEDIDIVFDRTSASESAMCDVLVKFGAFWIGDKVDPKTGLEFTHPVTLEYVRQITC